MASPQRTASRLGVTGEDLETLLLKGFGFFHNRPLPFPLVVKKKHGNKL